MHAGVIENRHTFCGPAAVAAPSAGRLHWQLRSRRARDVDAQASHLSGWGQVYDQLTRGAFDGSVDELTTGTSQVFRERTNRALRQRCRIPEDAIWLGITLVHDGSRLNGREVGASGVMVSGSPETFDLVTPASHDILGVVVPRAALEVLAAQQRRPLRIPTSGPATWLDVGVLRKSTACARLHTILALTAAADGSQAHHRSDAAHAALQASILDVACELLAAPDAAAQERSNAWSRRSLLSAIDAWVRSRPGIVPTVPDLCDHLHVSRRTLQNASQAATAMSPAAYLRSIRLNQARRALREAAPGSVRVCDIAVDWGFWNLSQFASDYRRHFGESPSQTLTCR